jgi:phosphoenolpyruvate carboxykinase (ATP)
MMCDNPISLQVLAEFVLQHYIQSVKFGQLSLHSSVNVSMKDGDITFFFSLSGAGKTTLSADPYW